MGGLPLWMVGRPQWLQQVEGAASPRSPLSVGLPTGEPLVGNWSRVKHLLEGWGLPQIWGMVEILETVLLALHDIEDCLEALSGHIADGIGGSFFLETVESVLEERERVIQERERAIEEKGKITERVSEEREGLRQERETHFSIA